MSKNFITPVCLACIVATGGLAGIATYQFTSGVVADQFYSEQARTLETSTLNAVTLSMRAASDASYVSQLQQMSSHADASLSALRKGSDARGVHGLPPIGMGNLENFEAAWAKVKNSIEQIAAARGSNAGFERLATESSQYATTVIEESSDAIGRVKASPAIDARLKQTLSKAGDDLREGIELLATSSTPTSDNLAIALEASKAYIAILTQTGGAVPRDKAIIDPLLKSFRSAQALSRSCIKAIEAVSGTVDNAPHAKAIWAERENLTAALTGLNSALTALPKSRIVSPSLLTGSVAIFLAVSLAGLTLILRSTRNLTRKAETIAHSVQATHKERSIELRQLTDELETVGQGDLTVVFQENAASTRDIAATLNSVFPQFRDIVHDVQQTIASLSAATEQTLSMARNNERSRTEQVQAIKHIGGLVDGLSNFNKEFERVIQTTRESSLNATSQIQRGSQAVEVVHEGVVKLSQSNLNIMHQAKAMTENIQSLEKLVDVVRQVANQAATVAFNAHLVAEVITDDDIAKRVRVSAEAMTKLTDSTKEAAAKIDTNLQAINVAAKDTQYVLDESQSDIKALMGRSSDAHKAMSAIQEQTRNLTEAINSVAGQTADLSSRSNEVAQTMGTLDHYVSEHSAASEQTATAIANLNAKAQRVGETIAHFKV